MDRVFRLVQRCGETVEGADIGPGRGDDNIRVGRMTGERAPLMAEADRHLTHGINALSDGFHGIFDQFVGNIHHPVNRLIHRIHRPRTNGRIGEFLPLGGAERDGGGGAGAIATGNLHQF